MWDDDELKFVTLCNYKAGGYCVQLVINKPFDNDSKAAAYMVHQGMGLYKILFSVNVDLTDRTDVTTVIDGFRNLALAAATKFIDSMRGEANEAAHLINDWFRYAKKPTDEELAVVLNGAMGN